MNAHKHTGLSSCRLCGTPGKLILSHVIPDFFIRSLQRQVPTGKSGQPQPTSIMMSLRPGEEGGQRQRGYWEKQSGINETMLCAVCEGRFSRYENYFRSFFYGKNPSPLKKVSVGKSVDLSSFVGLNPDILGVTAVKLDYSQFKLFVLSLVWRASVAKGSFFEKISLGSQHEARLAAMLNAENAGPDDQYAILMVDLQHAKYGLEDFFQQPDCVKDGTQRGCSFIIGGFMLVTFIAAAGHRPPDPVDSFCLRSSGDLLLISSRAQHIVRWWATRLRNAGKI
jgi:hypothetical protein